ncbi:GIY-YIG nuclease family protein [Longimicrobium terrae]|uniref:Putative endonuclease n=1 Tax=Longimicrobium terrae TaxID=1639882 RepID=A0A841H7F9_9BACT|nr:putative endonuclease [Longimicrobium terrae]MBB6073629.1 putative endonuclease [Longimicrobium terrae]NNC30309.1 GIY-YIG nuclease family protein [Longimicrobium terrae]
MHNYYAYILSGPTGVLYTGVTNDLVRRVREHREKRAPGFTSRYGVARLVWFEHTTDITAALAREKQIKGWSRAKKIALIRTPNPEFLDLAPTIGIVDGDD